jgi:hypothetical protein
MAVTGTNSENQKMKVLVQELVVNGVPFAPSASAIVALGGTITGATANDTMTAVADIALSTSNTYTDAAVNTAVNTAIASIENNFADLQAKVNEIITALNAAS